MIFTSKYCTNVLRKSNNLFGVILKPHLPSITVTAKICSKEVKEPNPKRPKPYPYETKAFTYFHFWIDGTLKRFDENSKIIVVDGNIGAGKTTLAKALAEEFDMKYIPEPSVDVYYKTPYGHDLREIDELMPPHFQCCDLKKFYENPHHHNVRQFQLRMLTLRFLDYISGLAHLLNTGEGLVMDRSIFSDRVFMDAMYAMGYVSKEVFNYYNVMYKNCCEELLRPHLIIYLDVTPEVSLQRIKKRNDPIEVNSKVLTKEYLGAIESSYKDKYLEQLSTHSEILLYDWNNFGDMEVVLEDIEKKDFSIKPYDQHFSDWKMPDDDWAWGAKRYLYTTDLKKFGPCLRIFPMDCPELFIPADEVYGYRDLVKRIPGMKYTEGFNPEMNDKVLFKKYNNHFRDKVDILPFLKEYFQ